MVTSKLQTWQSPHTGVTYRVFRAVTSYTDFAEMGNPKTAYIRVVPRYDFFNNGVKVTSTYSMDANGLQEHFAYVEHVYDANLVNSRFD